MTDEKLNFVPTHFINCVSTYICFIFIGWCLVWKLYLSKFKLVRELISQQTPEVNISNKTQKTL